MKVETLQDLFLLEIEGLYDAEQRLVKALPKMAQASSAPLRQAIESHLEETKTHVQRLEQIFASMRVKEKTQTCDAMKGMIEEGEDLISEIDESPLRDAAIIAAANRVEHYEIAAYGSARTFAEKLSMAEAAALLKRTLEEEKKADQKLTELAQTMVNDQALQTNLAR